jgi:hypothetical protein
MGGLWDGWEMYTKCRPDHVGNPEVHEKEPSDRSWGEDPTAM